MKLDFFALIGFSVTGLREMENFPKNTIIQLASSKNTKCLVFLLQCDKYKMPHLVQKIPNWMAWVYSEPYNLFRLELLIFRYRSAFRQPPPLRHRREPEGQLPRHPAPLQPRRGVQHPRRNPSGRHQKARGGPRHHHQRPSGRRDDQEEQRVKGLLRDVGRLRGHVGHRSALRTHESSTRCVLKDELLQGRLLCRSEAEGRRGYIHEISDVLNTCAFCDFRMCFQEWKTPQFCRIMFFVV